ncbi:hypothetical protein KIN20_033015 [Parelaphostrongylus tenuis]|uniref:Uncharacterized protein n=1 Tax=Parelaphostrongylus tenuis TaxID=148309 RepID=A0AAD5R7C1_PARTN|nr:hypothetical protein KIN20_033015 [Parelaphostrongylus tenuis]
MIAPGMEKAPVGVVASGVLETWSMYEYWNPSPGGESIRGYTGLARRFNRQQLCSECMTIVSNRNNNNQSRTESMDKIGHNRFIRSNKSRVRESESEQRRRTEGKKVAQQGKETQNRPGRQHNTILTATPLK